MLDNTHTDNAAVTPLNSNNHHNLQFPAVNAQSLVAIDHISLARNIADALVTKPGAARSVAFLALKVMFPDDPKDSIAKACRLHSDAAANAVAQLSIASGHFTMETVDTLVGSLLSIHFDAGIESHV